MDTPDQYVFQRMGIRTMPDIVQQDRRFYAQFFVLADLNSFCLKLGHGIAHQVISPQRMMQPAMHCTRIDQVRKGHLMDPPQRW
jgi:hypothetical protein